MWISTLLAKHWLGAFDSGNIAGVFEMDGVYAAASGASSHGEK